MGLEVASWRLGVPLSCQRGDLELHARGRETEEMDRDNSVSALFRNIPSLTLEILFSGLSSSSVARLEVTSPFGLNRSMLGFSQ